MGIGLWEEEVVKLFGRTLGNAGTRDSDFYVAFIPINSRFKREGERPERVGRRAGQPEKTWYCYLLIARIALSSRYSREVRRFWFS